MGFFEDLLGFNKDSIWKKVAEEVGGKYVDKGFLSGEKVEADFGKWSVTFDIEKHSNKNSTTYYTRLRAPFFSKDGFKFTIYNSSFFSFLGNIIGLQDIIVGDTVFDEKFVIKGNNETKVRKFFKNDTIRDMLLLESSIQIEIKDDEGWFGAHFPKGVDELYLRVYGYPKSVEYIKKLYELFAECLIQLTLIETAKERGLHIDF